MCLNSEILDGYLRPHVLHASEFTELLLTNNESMRHDLWGASSLPSSVCSNLLLPWESLLPTLGAGAGACDPELPEVEVDEVDAVPGWNSV